MADPTNCAPGDPRVEADLADFVNWDPEVRFTPDDATHPRGAGVAVDAAFDSDALAEQLALEAQVRAERRAFFSDKQPWYSHAVNWVRIPQELFRSFERYTNVPFYSWFRRVEDALDDVDLATTDPVKEIRTLAQRLRPTEGGVFSGNREEKKQVQRLFEARLHDPVAARELENNLPPGVVVAADQLDGIYRRYFSSQDFTDEEISDFFKTFMSVRERDGDYLGYKLRGRIPKIMQSLDQEFRTGEIMLDAREWDFQVLGEQIIRAHARVKHLGPAWNMVKAQVDAFEAEGVVSPDLLAHMHSYLDQVRHAPDHWQISMARFMNKTTEQLFGRRLPDNGSLDMVQWFLSTNYFVNMAWNTGVAIRNFMQPLITSYPILGERFAWQGYHAAWKATRDAKLLDRYAKRGVITRDTEPLQANAIRESMNAVGANRIVAGGQAQEFWNWYHEKGWTMFRSAENVNRIMSYQGMVDRATHFGKQYLNRKITWNQFVEASRLDSMDSIAGPITNQMRSLLDAGDLEQASHLMGLQFTRNTQFVYKRGNTPYVMQSTVGRLFGQYGTWPAWYASYLSNMAMKGSIRNRVTQAARWGAANSAILYGASEVFGVDMARWSFFSPMGYMGGPFTEVARGAIAQAQVLSGSTDPVDRINAGRFLNSYQQVVPHVPWGMGRNVRDAVAAAQQDDWATAAKRFLGFQPAPEP